MAGPSRPARARPPKQPPVRGARDVRDALRRRSVELVKKISDKDKFAIFLDPVPVDEVPGYLDVITRPMDLGTVKKNVHLGVYHAPNDLRADLDLIWANCIKFNAQATIYHKEAVRLRALAGKFFEEFLRTLARDGLPYGPRGTAAAQKKSKASATGGVANAQLVSADDPAASPYPLHTISQRFRNVVRGRTKVLQAQRPPNVELTDLENAAVSAANTLLPKPDTKQIYDGPYQRIRRFPNAHAAHTFPYVQGGRLEKFLQPFPYAWQTLGKHTHHDPSNLNYHQRMNEMKHANQYQSFVTKSAPIARRLLATLLDPLAVVEHDARTQSARASSAPKKRPRHGEIIQPTEQPHTVHNNMEMDICEKTPEKKTNDMPPLPPQPVQPALPPPSDEAVRDLQDVLKLHNIDYSFLNTILNTPNTETPEAPNAMEISPAKNTDSANELKSKLKDPTPRQSDEIEDKSTAETREKSAIVDACNNNVPATTTADDGAAVQSSVTESTTNTTERPYPVTREQEEASSEEDSGSEEDSDGYSESEDESDEESDEELSRLLESNHHAMQNILRLRSLKEVAVGQARADLEAEETHCISVLIEDMAKSTLKLTPRMLLPKVQAGIMLMDKAKSILMRKRKLDAAEDAEKAKKKTKVHAETPTAVSKAVANVVANGVSNPVNAGVTGQKLTVGNPKVAKKSGAVVSQVDKVTTANRNRASAIEQS